MQMHDTDTNNLLPIHIIQGANDFAKIKIGTTPRVGQTIEILYLLGQFGEPFSKKKMNWVIMTPDKESDI